LGNSGARQGPGENYSYGGCVGMVQKGIENSDGIRGRSKTRENS